MSVIILKQLYMVSVMILEGTKWLGHYVYPGYNELTLEEIMKRLIALLLILTAVPPMAMAVEAFGLDVEAAGGENAGSYKDPSLGMEFVYVQGGCYQMGDTFGDGFPSEQPVHEVCVNDFALAKYDVTVGEFRQFIVATGYKTEAELEGGCGGFNGSKWVWDASKNWRNPGFNQNDSQPVVCVSWNDAEAFINWLSKVSGAHYRLPTEAEWEYAARSGGKKEKYAGGNDINAVAWYYDNDGLSTHSVGTKRPNGLRLYDMSGNVLQWVQDWYDENYYRDSLRSNPQGARSGHERVLRGSAWSDKPAYVRTTRRSMKSPSHRGSILGFRLACSAR